MVDAAQANNFFTLPEQYKNGQHVFVQPTKKIVTPDDLELFKKSAIIREYLQFVAQAQASVVSKAISATAPPEAKFVPIIQYLERLTTLVDEVPPIQQKMRFGNTAFKTWHQRMAEISQNFLAELLPQEIAGAAIELQTYLQDSYGSNVRIDYGSGHEMAFMFFLFALQRLGLFTPNEFESLVHNVFYAYIKLMRKIQLTYWLEPAGSQGVWGIDDYHFLPFLFGAAELIDHQQVATPNDIHNESLVEQFKSDYMYLNCISFINQVKKGSFAEHSPMLNDISGAASWTKVTQGMVKMYQAKVLQEFPVIKHAFFGSIIPFK